MASAPTLPLLTAEEYLNTSFEHDVDFVDGVLIERGMPTTAHSLLQQLLLFWFGAHQAAFRFKVLPEYRTEIIPRSRYRIPDVMLCPTPIPKGKVCDVVPWVVIEILSPDDTVADIRDRCRDYARIGVPQVILMDPEEYIAYRFENGSLIETKFDALPLPAGSSVPFSSEELFRRVEQERNEE